MTSDQRAAEAVARRILLVDDNVSATYLLSMLLKKLDGHQIQTAHDGCSALEMIRNERPEAVLLDIGLPKMDGYEVARRVREDASLDNILLVALTGYGQEEDLRKSREAGFDEHVVKPPSTDDLRRILAHPKLPT